MVYNNVRAQVFPLRGRPAARAHYNGPRPRVLRTKPYRRRDDCCVRRGRARDVSRVQSHARPSVENYYHFTRARRTRGEHFAFDRYGVKRDAERVRPSLDPKRRRFPQTFSAERPVVARQYDSAACTEWFENYKFATGVRLIWRHFDFRPLRFVDENASRSARGGSNTEIQLRFAPWRYISNITFNRSFSIVKYSKTYNDNALELYSNTYFFRAFLFICFLRY